MSSERNNVKKTYENTPRGIAEAKLDAKIERHFRLTHRGVPNGRNFWAWNRDHRPDDDKKYRENFDKIFPNAPGAGI